MIVRSVTPRVLVFQDMDTQQRRRKGRFLSRSSPLTNGRNLGIIEETGGDVMKPIIHVFGASGSGTTTLGTALSTALGLRLMDTDDYYWLPTDPCFTQSRPPQERLALMRQHLEECAGAVLSGSIVGWGDPLIPPLTLAVRLVTPTEVRLQRLKEREYRRFGERIRPGGDMYAEHLEFLQWAAQYDTADEPTRSSAMHNRWQQTLGCPLLLLDGTRPVEELTARVCQIYRHLTQQEELPMNEVLQAMKDRRSIRKFQPTLPSKTDLEQIIEAGLYAANGRGMQNTLTIAVTNKALRDRLAEVNRQIGGWDEGFDPFYGAPAILIVLSPKDWGNRVYDGSLVMGNMMLAAHTLGLGSIWIHRAKEEFELPEFQQLLRDLGVEGDWEGIGHCAVGYAAGDSPKAAKRKDGRVVWAE